MDCKILFEASDKSRSWWNSGPMWIYILLQIHVDGIDHSKTLNLKVLEWWSSNGQHWGNNTAVDYELYVKMSFADNKFYVRMSSYRIRRHFADMTWNYWTWCERRIKRCKEFSTLHTKWTRIRAMTCKRELINQATKHVQHSSDDILESYIIDSVLDKFCWVNTAGS